MKEIFLTSDLHFMHNKPFLYEPRGFVSIKEMNETIVERWNKIVKKGDIVYNLGDFALNDVEAALPFIRQLNGVINWIFGNHDTDKKINQIVDECPNVWPIGWAEQMKYGKFSIYMSHYPTLTANYDEKHFNQHVLALHGHTHQKTNWINPANPFTYHIGMDSHNCTPIHIDECIVDIRQQWNQIGQLPTSSKPQDTYPYGELIQ